MQNVTKQEKRKFQLICDITWSSRKTYNLLRDCTLQAYVQHDFGDNFTPVDVFMKVENAQELTDHIVSETNIYAAQKGCNF